MGNFQNLLLKLALLLLLLLVLSQVLLLFPQGRFLSRTDRLEGKPWPGLAPASQDVIN